MHIKEYFRQIQELLDQVSGISIQDILLDERSEFIGYTRGQITFIEGYRLYISEYIDVEYSIDKIKYSYHFMSKDRVIFRYDNASDPHAKFLMTYPNHKHNSEGLLEESEAPDLDTILKEVISLLEF